MAEPNAYTDLLASTLEKLVTSRLSERGLVVWLDKDGVYSAFVDSLKERRAVKDFFAPVVAYRGSFLETMLELESHQAGLDPEPMLLHVPGHTDVSIRQTPLLEAYKAGTRFERSLDTHLREVAAGKVAPQELEAFLKQAPGSLQEAESWLKSKLSGEGVGLAAYLKNLQPEWVLDELVRAGGDLPGRVKSSHDLEDVRAYLERHTGFSPAFSAFFLQGEDRPGLRSLTEAFVGWLLCVEYVHDLSRAPVLAELQALRSVSAPLLKTSRNLVEVLRKRYPDRYREYAMQTELRLESELAAGSAEELGKIDTFSREDTRLLEGALECLAQGRWDTALTWASQRLESPSIWVQKDLWRHQEWSLVQSAARLGQAVERAGKPLRGASTLEQAVKRYTGSSDHPEGAQLVDRAHREFEQTRLRHLSPQLPHFAALAGLTTDLRRRYRDWVDDLTGAFADLCASEGFLPPPELQQRNLYEQVVHPLTQVAQAHVAYFLVDALRFEMAAELVEWLTERGCQLHLKARLAELPSKTPVGMNALAPVCRDGRLTLDKPFTGFRAGEYTVRNPEGRARAMGERSLDQHSGARRSPVRLDLQEIGNLTLEALKKKVREAALVVVHSPEIDSAGEADVGLATFDRWLGQLRSAVHHLRNAGIEEFVITADHGFLLLDDTREPVTCYADAMDRRFLLADAPVKAEGLVSVPLKALNYLGAEGHLMFLRDSRIFKSKGSAANTFVHGGNSLQERVIPVLTLSYRAAPAPRLARYQLATEVLAPVLGCSRIRVRLEKAGSQGLLDFVGSKVVPVALRVPELPSLQVVIKQSTGADVVHQRLQLQVETCAEVFFTLEGAGPDRAPLELFHPDGDEEVTPHRLQVFFEVLHLGGSATVSPEKVLSWVEHFPDEGVRRVFEHIEAFGSVNETELLSFLGNARAVRRFSLQFESYLKLLPFHVHIEMGAGGKRYVK